MLLVAIWQNFFDIIGAIALLKLACQTTRYFITGKWDIVERRPRTKSPTGALNLTR